MTPTVAPDTEPRMAWHPVRGEFLPFVDVYGYDPDEVIDDDHAGPSEIDHLIAEHQVDVADVLAVGITLIVAEAIRPERAFRARPLTVRRALVTRHRRAARRDRRHHRLATRSSR